MPEMGVDRQVVDLDLLGIGPEQAGDLTGQVLDLDLPLFAGLAAFSPVSIANSAAPCVSPTNRMPSGPNASGPADFRSGFPCLRLAEGSAAIAMAAVNEIPASAMAATRIPILVIGWFSFVVEPVDSDRCQTSPAKPAIIRETPEESTGLRRETPNVFRVACVFRRSSRLFINRMGHSTRRPQALGGMVLIGQMLIGLAMMSACYDDSKTTAPVENRGTDLSDYRRPPEKDAGRDAKAHVRLALWCESHGLGAERMKHLAMAVLYDPSNGLARGLMGLVAYHGKWERPDDVSRQAQDDPKRKALMQEYLQARAQDL